MSNVRTLEWTLGFRNHATGKFLTQETFGFALNCNGTSLKKKQTVTLMSAPDGSVHIRTHLNKYMYGDKDGKVKGDADAPSKDTQWTIEPQADGTWALKSAFGFYFHGAGDNLTAFVKELPADGKWVVVLAMHPQINLYNMMRKRFVHLSEGELHCDEDIPWGEDALLTLIFFDEHPEGRYGLVASNGKYLTASGRLVDSPSGETEFLLGFHDDQISFCDANRQYLSCVGAKGVLKVNKKNITKDELFMIQDSEPQFTIVSHKGKQVSVRSGVEVKADQTTVEDSERFQLEITPDGKGHLLTNKLFYWTVGSDGVISLSAKAKGADTALTVVYNGNTTKFIGPNGKYITVKPNGALVANGDGSEESAFFTFTIINRPELVLRGQFGFVGLKGASGRVECNKSRGEIFQLQPNNGAYFLRANGKYWTVDQDGVAAVSSTGVPFFLEFVEESKVMIKHADSGKYLEGEQNGGFKASGSSKNINTLWEF